MLAFKVFDPKVGDWLQDTQGKVVEEHLDNTILENLLPNEIFSFALVDEATTAEDLQRNHPDGHKLLFSSGSRFIFGSEDAQAAMENIFPEAPERGLNGIKDRGAYGALLIGECDNSSQIISILVVDRSGESDANAYPPRISQKNREDANETDLEIARGSITLSSANLIIFQDQLKDFSIGMTYKDSISLGKLRERAGTKIDSRSSVIQKPLSILIVDDETGENGGILPNDVARELTGDCHGRMSQALALEYGLKINPESGATDAMIQFRSVLPNFDNDPNAPGTHKIAKGTLLGQDLSDLPWQLPQWELPPDLILAKSSFKGSTKPPIGLHQKEIWLGAKSISANGKMSVSSLIPLYPGLLKDVQPQLEPKMAALAAAQNDPMSLAQLYITSNDDRQKFHAVSDHNDDNEDLTPINSRPDSPELKFIRAAVASQNTAALQTPLAVKELKKFVKNEWKSLALGQDKSIAFERSMALPDKKLTNGEICVPWLPDSEELIVYRPPVINTNGIHVLTNKLDVSLPYSDNAQYIAISDQNPIGRSIMADMALDFDGDHVAFALATDYPNLTREVKLKQEATNRYPDIVKEKKQEFDGASQETAALQMARSPVGLIANGLIATQSEISAVETLQNPHNSWVKPADRVRFASEVQQTMHQALASVSPERPFLVKRPNNLSDEGKKAFGLSSSQITTLATNIIAHSPSDDQLILRDYKLLLREVVGVASGQNQIAVDMPKSARAADAAAIMDSSKFLAHKSNIQQEKKHSDIYLNKTLTADGISPQEILAATTNQYFVENKQLQSPPSQFKELFADVQFTPIQKAQANGYQERFQAAWIEASSRLQKEQHESGVSMQLQTADGKSIEVTNLHRGESEVKYTPERITKVIIEPKPASGKNNYHTFQVLDARGKRIGDLCELSAKELGITKAATSFDVGEGKLQSRQELSGLYFGKARELAAEFANSIPPEERKSYTAALWAEATKETAKDTQEQNIPKAVLYAFPDELADQVSKTNMNRVHVKLKTAIEPSDHSQTFKAVASNDNGKLQTALYTESAESIGFISQMGYPLRPGTLEGTMSPGGIAVLQVKIPEIAEPLTIGKVNEFALAGQPIDTMVGAQITIAPVKIDSYRLALDGKPISDALSKEVADFMAATGLNDGEPFTTSVISRNVDDKRSSLSLTFDDGSMVQCVSADQSLPQYQGEQVQLSIVNSPQYSAGVFLRDAKSQTQQIGEFTAWTGKAAEGALSPRQSLDLLVKNTPLNGEINGRGVVDRNRPLSGSFNTTATISTDGTNQILEITAQDLNPPSWQLQERPEKSADVPINERLRAYNSQKSPVMLENGDRSILAIDSSVGSATAQWVEKSGATIITGGDFRREVDRGFAVIEIATESISPAFREKMTEQGMVTITTKPEVFDRLIEKIPAPQHVFDGHIAGVNIASNSIDPVGQQIAAMLRVNYSEARSLDDIAKLTIEQNPELVRIIAVNGGDNWLAKCEHQGRENLSGKGVGSPLVKALATAYGDNLKPAKVEAEQAAVVAKAAEKPKATVAKVAKKAKKSRSLSM
jgi:hypothetical protein